MLRRTLACAVSFASLTACSSGLPAADAQVALPPAEVTRVGLTSEENYRIGPTDKLSIRVFQVEDLSFDEIFVDANGSLQMPLIGAVPAAGMTADELSRELERRLGERYLRNPSVTVIVSAAASQKITVDGAVTKPGVYQMRGRTTLMQAVAMAEGPTRVADLRNVAVFRTDEGGRKVALFDLGEIRSGRLEDPVLRGDDIVVVDTSRLSAALRDVVQALPGLAVFAYIR